MLDDGLSTFIVCLNLCRPQGFEGACSQIGKQLPTAPTLKKLSPRHFPRLWSKKAQSQWKLSIVCFQIASSDLFAVTIDA